MAAGSVAAGYEVPLRSVAAGSVAADRGCGVRGCGVRGPRPLCHCHNNQVVSGRSANLSTTRRTARHGISGLFSHSAGLCSAGEEVREVPDGLVFSAHRTVRGGWVHC